VEFEIHEAFFRFQKLPLFDDRRQDQPTIGSLLAAGPMIVKANRAVANPPPNIKIWVRIKNMADLRFVFAVLPKPC
jgi:hypothetical protein